MPEQTAEEIARGEHRRENCQFYPACWIAGDCDEDDWKTSDCGLPDAEKAEKRGRWLRDLALMSARHDLIKRYEREVWNGEHDHRLEEMQAVAALLAGETPHARSGE